MNAQRPSDPNTFLPKLSTKVIRSFQHEIYEHAAAHPRPLPWRQTDDPYRILVSEIMLQQTQAERVIAKYHDFLQEFPDIKSLANAPLREVLAAWRGLGYNRRAIALKEAARQIIDHFGGSIPENPDDLRKLPGIGPYTAAAIAAFAFNKPVMLIETNIRTVFIHFFFRKRDKVKDKELLPLIEATLDRSKARDWYNALMDYGAMLKKYHANPSRQSAHHVRQSPFKGSVRAIRGAILRCILDKERCTIADLVSLIGLEQDRVEAVLSQLVNDGFIKRCSDAYVIAE